MISYSCIKVKQQSRVKDVSQLFEKVNIFLFVRASLQLLFGDNIAVGWSSDLNETQVDILEVHPEGLEGHEGKAKILLCRNYY